LNEEKVSVFQAVFLLGKAAFPVQGLSEESKVIQLGLETLLELSKTLGFRSNEWSKAHMRKN